MSTEKELLDKQLVALVDSLPNLQAQADRLTIDSPETVRTATALRSSVKHGIKAIKTRRLDLTGPVKLYVKGIEAKAKEVSGPLEAIDYKLKTGMEKYQDYLDEQQRKVEAKRAEEEKAKQAEIDRLNKQADAAKTFSATVKVEEKIEAVKSQELTPDIAVQKTVRSAGGMTSFHKEWKHEIVDAGKVPREYCIYSNALIRGAIKRGVREIQGVQIYEKNLASGK